MTIWNSMGGAPVSTHGAGSSDGPIASCAAEGSRRCNGLIAGLLSTVVFVETAPLLVLPEPAESSIAAPAGTAPLVSENSSESDWLFVSCDLPDELVITTVLPGRQYG